MKFIINDTIEYSPADGTLWLVNNKKEKVALSPTSNRLLYVLIKNRNGIISREELLRKAWDEYGLISSNNSLNHYISALRKKFEHLGVTEEVIKTEPRVGFYIAQTVTVTESRPAKKNLSQYKRLIYTLNGIFFFILFSATIIIYVKRPSIKTDLTGIINGCNVHTLGVNKMNARTSLEMAKQFMEDNELECSEGQIIYFNADSRVISGEPGRVFMAICEQHKGDVISCMNHLHAEWRE